MATQTDEQRKSVLAQEWRVAEEPRYMAVSCSVERAKLLAGQVEIVGGTYQGCSGTVRGFDGANYTVQFPDGGHVFVDLDLVREAS